MAAIAAFTGPGLLSIKRSRNTPAYFWCSSSAFFQSLRAAASTSAFTSAGIRLEATLTTPNAPRFMNSTVMPSSPLKISKPAGTTFRISSTRSGLPPASLIARMVGQSFANRPTVSTVISTPHRPGTL